MKAVVWIVVLFAAAVGIVLTSGIYTGNVYIVVGQIMVRVNLHAFILGLVLFVVTLYFLIKFIVGLMNIPARMQRFGTARKGRQAAVALNSAGLAFFEGRFEKAEQEAAKVLENKEAGDNRNLALMLGAHAADQMENFELRDHYLKETAAFPLSVVGGIRTRSPRLSDRPGKSERRRAHPSQPVPPRPPATALCL